jgi:hypothetical protein
VKLWHGTKAENLSSILRHGFHGRPQRGRAALAPLPGRIYLSSDLATALTYAFGGLVSGPPFDVPSVLRREGGLVEVEAATASCAPDEDWLGELLMDVVQGTIFGPRTPYGFARDRLESEGRNFIAHRVFPAISRRTRDGWAALPAHRRDDLATWARVGKTAINQLLRTSKGRELLQVTLRWAPSISCPPAALRRYRAWRLPAKSVASLTGDGSNLARIAERVRPPTLVLKPGTLLYHGTAEPTPFEESGPPRAPAWFTRDKRVATIIGKEDAWREVKRGTPRPRLLTWRVERAIELPVLRTEQDYDALVSSLKLPAEKRGPYGLAQGVCGPFRMPGWVIPYNYASGKSIFPYGDEPLCRPPVPTCDDIMLCDTSALRLVGQEPLGRGSRVTRRTTFTLEPGTILYHGTSEPRRFEEAGPPLRPAWFTRDLDVAATVARRRMLWEPGQQPRVLVYRVERAIELPLLRENADLKRWLGRTGRRSARTYELAFVACEKKKLPGWIVPANYARRDSLFPWGGDPICREVRETCDDILLCDTFALRLIRTISAQPGPTGFRLPPPARGSTAHVPAIVEREGCSPPYFHVTAFENVENIAAVGLRLGRGQVFGAAPWLARHSRGKVFFSTRDGVEDWVSSVKERLEYDNGHNIDAINWSRADENPDADLVLGAIVPVVLRFDRLPKGAKVEVDDQAGPAPCSFFIRAPIPPDWIRYWSPGRREWRPISRFDETPWSGVEVVDGYLEVLDRFMPA